MGFGLTISENELLQTYVLWYLSSVPVLSTVPVLNGVDMQGVRDVVLVALAIRVSESASIRPSDGEAQNILRGTILVK